MERNFKAFISYRHLPLQMSVAKQLHKYIEHYDIPKELRKDGEKHPGLVFRDQDELPLSGNLSDSIQTALDHSEFLIVICTPDTAKSQWVLREITYFIQTHGRDHVLAVLAEGDESTSFPKELTEDVGDGDLIHHVEPLAANIVAPTEAGRKKLLKTEGLRLIAALIGCNYDDLFRREQRYKRRRLATAASVLLLAAGAYIATLSVKNHRITEQNVQISEQNTQISEQLVQISEQNTQISRQKDEIAEQLRIAQLNDSRSLTEISGTLREKGDFRGAVKNAYEALPTTQPDRPYYLQAERQLVSALNLYEMNEFAYVQSIEQETDIRHMLLSPDGSKLATWDMLGTLRLFDCDSGRLLWSDTLPDYAGNVLFGFGFSEDGSFVTIHCWNTAFLNDLRVYDVSSGVLLHEDKDSMPTAALNANHTDLYAAYLCMRDISTTNAALEIKNLADGRVFARLQWEEGKNASVHDWTLSEDARFIAAVGAVWNAEEKKNELFVWLEDLRTEQVQCLPLSFEYSVSAVYKPAFCGDILAVACDDTYVSAVEGFSFKDSELTSLYHKELSSASIRTLNGSVQMGGSICCFAPTYEGDAFYFCAKDYVAVADAETGEVRNERHVGSEIILAQPMNQGKLLVLATYGGTQTFYSSTGSLFSDINMYTFEAEQKAYAASVGPGNDEKPLMATYAMVFQKSKNRVSMLRFLDEREHEALYQPQEGEELLRSYFLSPDQSLLVGLYNEYDSVSSTYTLYGTWIETKAPYANGQFSVEVPEYAPLKDGEYAVFVTSDKKLFMNGYLIDMEAQTLEMPLLFEGEQDYGLYRVNGIKGCQNVRTGELLAARADAKTGLLRIWREADGKVQDITLPPAPERKDVWDSAPQWHLECLAPDGSAIISCWKFEGGWNAAGEVYDLLLYSAKSGELISLDKEKILVAENADLSYFAAAADSSAFAALDPAGKILLINASDGSVSRTLDHAGTVQSVTRLLFAPQGRLLVFDSYGTMTVYDTESGTVLETESFADQLLKFQKRARYEVTESADGKRLFITFDTTHYTTAGCIVLDTERWEQVGMFIGASAYLTADNMFIFRPNNPAQLSLLPCYGSEEILAIAKDYLENGIH